LLLLADAPLAAIACGHDRTLTSFDRDFARFTSVDHVIPAAH